MGSVRCTLCCSEIFHTTEEYTCHLKQVLENIYCSQCRLRFVSLRKLVEHYALKKCKEPKHPRMDPIEIIDLEEVSLPDSEVVPVDMPIQVTENNQMEVNMLEVNQVEEENIEVSQIVDNQIYINQILEQQNLDVAMDIPPNVNDMSSMTSQPAAYKGGGVQKCPEDNAKVFCCSCGMKFLSITEHLKTFHIDEEVLVMGGSIQVEALLNAPTTNITHIEEVTSEEIPQDNVEENVQMEEYIPHPEAEEPEVIVCDRDNESVEVVKPVLTPPLTSVQIDQLEGKVEECVDKDGRIYLRKFVRVEKFWTEKDEIKAAQMLTKFKNFEPVRDVPVGSVSIKSKDEAVSDKLAGPPKKLFQCNKCKKTFQTMIHFRYHVCTLKKGPTTTCNLCGHESTSTKELRAHWRMHQRQRRVAATALWELQSSEGIATNGNAQGEEATELQCERCGEMYKKSEELVHVAMHDEESPLHCNKCDESFDSKDRLSRHMRTHKEQKAHICLYCGKSFTDSNAFKLHVRSHTGEKPFKCTYCGKTFSRPYERMKHERIHTGERPHVCEICGKTFRVSYCLTLHKRTHSGDRPYCCDTCGKRFKAHSAYKHHVQIHSEERNYKCPYCPKAFKTMVHLAGHKKTHTKPFTCTECNRRFASLYSVKAHMESHKTGDNRFRYRCFVCGASYARAFALQYHMRTHGPSDAPEDVAEVLEICDEDTEKKDEDISDIDDTCLVKKGEDDHSECEVSL